MPLDTAPPYVAPRTCRLVNAGQPTSTARESARSLSHYADAAAYVLIAEPGAGKTTAFETEAESQGGECVAVRKFRTFNDKPEWHDTTLFLDGLDESRAGRDDGRTPLDEIRGKLDRLGCPPFRLSCRWADWMAATDRERLKEVSPDGTLIVLRLEPLSEQNVKAILAKNHGVPDGDGFIATAKQRGIHRLLGNPHNLELLAKSVSGGQWPDSRQETFDQACRMLAGESNGEHLAGNPSAADTSALIKAAGRLCAAQLLSGAAGYTLSDRAAPDADYPAVTEVGGGAKGDTARNVLGTRLFVGVSEGKLAPAHRQIAEFLGARYVSELIDHEGLPVRRILALITGFDGELLPSFRNFVSWLAVHNKRSRKTLSRLNPSGMIYAGDRQTYSTDEKREILRNVRRECWNPGCFRSISRVSGIGAIVCPELEETFREILSEGKRDHEHQPYVMLLLQMLADGEALPGLLEVLEGMVRDPSWKPGVRCAALDVLTAYHARGRLGSDVLTRLLAEAKDGSLDDPRDELLGIVLKTLYPKLLSVAAIQRYLREPTFGESGEYVGFWMDHVPRESTPEQLADLLDGIAARFEDYRPFLVRQPGRYSRMPQLPMELLQQVIRETRWRNPDESVAADRLYEWLSVVSAPGLPLPEHHVALIKSDLQWNADALKALIAHAVETCVRSGEECTDLVDRRLFGARPRGYGRWCLEMAMATGDSLAASFYLGELLDCVTGGGHRADGLTLEEARTGLAADEAVVSRFDEMVARRARVATSMKRLTVPAPEADMECAEDSAEQRAWQARIAAEAAALRAGHGTPSLLHSAAEVYLGIENASAGSSPRQRLRELVGSRDDLVDLLLAGMEACVVRNDLPRCDQVVRLFDQGQVDWLVLTFVAGLHSLERSGRLSDGDLSEEHARLAVTILYMFPPQVADPDTAGVSGVPRPGWFRTLLRDNPALVADTLCRSAACKLATGVQPARELRELAEAEDHREVAELAALSVLERFPSADTDSTLMSLCWSLKAALQRCDWQSVGRVIEERLGRGSPSAEEQGCWLVAGYLVAPEGLRRDMLDLKADEDGLKWLGRFVAAGRFPKEFTRRFAPTDFEPFVAVLAASGRIHGLSERAYWATSDVIAALADDASAGATEALDALRQMPDAEPWSPTIADARDRQASKRREHEYRHSEFREVVKALDSCSPANAGDLAALVFDKLKELSRRIRDGDTTGRRKYWNVDSWNRATRPRPENGCRDILLDDLRERLEPLGIEARAESRYAEDTRADIQVAYGGFNVPVEVKRSCHPDLWTALHEQLIGKYTRDPRTAGYGIYLVFWFGDTEKCRPTKSAHGTPETADGVRRALEQSLGDRARQLISICVVDVSPTAVREARP